MVKGANVDDSEGTWSFFFAPQFGAGDRGERRARPRRGGTRGKLIYSQEPIFS